MRRLSEYLPKCGLIIYDQPLLVRQIETFRKCGISDVFISISDRYESFLRSLIESTVKDMHITFLVDKAQKGPIDAFMENLKDLEGRPMFFLLGDIYIEDDRFFHEFTKNPAESIVLDTVLEPQIDRIERLCHIIEDASGEIQRIVEKPKRDEIKGQRTWTGASYHPAWFAESLKTVIGNIQQVHFGEIYRELLEKSSPITYFDEKGSVINLTFPEDLLLANTLEFRRIYQLRPDDKRHAWNELVKITAKPFESG